ncbi:hypothetical protein [Porphyromonas sp.]
MGTRQSYKKDAKQEVGEGATEQYCFAREALLLGAPTNIGSPSDQ